MKRTIFSFIIAIAMCISICTPVFADSTIEATEVVEPVGEILIDDEPISIAEDFIITTESFEDGEVNTIRKAELSGDAQTRSAAVYLNLSIKGNSEGKITGTVTMVGSDTNTKLDLFLQSKETGGSWSTRDKIENRTFTKNKSFTLSCQTANTKLFRVRVEGKFIGVNIDKHTNSVLFNKKATRYPSATEKHSGKKCKIPASNLAVNQKERDPKFRAKYIDKFEEEYPKANMTWSNYEIHHMRPLKYGGSNAMSNGIALTKSQHSKYTSWWASY